MLARRSRLQVKPNISQGSKSAAKPPVEKVVEPINSHSSSTPTAEQSSIADLAASLDNPTPVENVSKEARGLGHASEKAIPIAEPAKPIIVPPEESDSGFIDPLAPERRVAHSSVEKTKTRDRLFSSSDCYEPVLPRPRRKFTGDEELDPKKMRMMDMIYWNPKKQKGMSRKYKDTESVVGDKPAQSSEKPASVSGSAKTAAPQVKIGADGRLVIDEESLVVAKDTTNESVWETVEEDRMTRKVTSLSFRNRLWRKGTAWTEKETELFYEILRCTGPDFGLMHEFFPSRARNELKSKFNKEERTNWEKLKEVMSRPALLDDDLYERAADLQKEIEEEALAKKMKKEKDKKGTGMTFKRRRKKDREEQEEGEDVSDNSEDLVEEASKIINEMEKEKKKKRKRKARRSRSESSDSEQSDSNADDEVNHEIELREKKPKQLSAKAQALLDETIGKSLSAKAKALLDQTLGKSLSAKAQALFNEATGKSKGAEDASNEGGNEDVEDPPQTSFDGYEEEDDGNGSPVTIDSDVELVHSSKLLVRNRHAPRITLTSEPIAGRSSAPTLTPNVQDEDVTEDVRTPSASPEPDVDSSSSTPEPSNAFASAKNESGKKDDLTSGNDNVFTQSDEPTPSISPSTPAMTPIPSQTDLSRPRRSVRGKPARKPILKSALIKKPPNLKASTSDKATPCPEQEATPDSTVEQPSVSTSPRRERTRTRSMRSVEQPTRSLILGDKEDKNTHKPLIGDKEGENADIPTPDQGDVTGNNDGESAGDVIVEESTSVEPTRPKRRRYTVVEGDVADQCVSIGDCLHGLKTLEVFWITYQENYEGDENVGEIMDRLCKKIYALDEEKRLRQRAMLCHVYWLALHDEWHRARDLMLMSHLQAIVDHSDTDTQILYNRTICQLGLCAFRHGFIKEAHQGLSEIQNTQRAKELLAQAIAMRQHERTAEQEKLERQRQIPYHMHINVELMECVYLICSMLLEIPHMASCEFEMRRRLLSRSFHYQLKQSEKSSLIGPPENTREHVVAASRAMLAGDWKKCRDYIVNDKMNQKVWNLFRNAESVKEMVVKRIQEESLRTYLLMYSTVYTTVSLEKLATLFELDKKQVHSVISKMIIQEELSATLDEPTDCLMMHRVEPSRLQMIALNLTDKLQQLADNNEQILEPRTGRAGYAGPGQWFPGRSDRQGDKQKGDRGGVYQSDRRAGQSESHSKRAWGGAGATAAQSGTSQRRRESQKSRF
ncbi:hypothetical protein Y032_0162g3419 [Ancylostoma ceylanicum]|nr:hypothetical protein Y032_0162g3419 [Ancylostoma ceylanicum]